MKLNLRVDKYLDSDGGPPPQVFATIYPVDPGSGRKQRSQTPRRELVPISDRPEDVRSVELAPGRYVVEVTMPSGDLLSDNVEVPAGKEAGLVLKAEDSPHEWLGWQHLMGTVSEEFSTQPTSAFQAARAEPPKRKAAARKKSKPLPFGGPVAAVVTEPPAPASTHALPAALNFLDSPLPALLGWPNVDIWAALDALPDYGVPLIVELNEGFPARPVPIHVRDEERAVYRVVHGSGSPSGATALHSTLPRDFIAVPQEDTVELVSLPTPWFVVGSGREAVVELVVQQGIPVRDFATSITVRDERLGLLLGYLSSGALGAAREIAETAQGMLYGKTENHLAAAAGAYAMVGTAVDAKTHEWHSWVENLCNWFPQMPDGAILLAQLHLRLRRSHADLDKARVLLKQAYRRGLPFYSLGIRWLLEGLERVALSDPEAETMREAVQAVAWRIHPMSAFTILHLERP